MSHAHSFQEITTFGDAERHFRCTDCGFKTTNPFPNVNPYTGVVEGTGFTRADVETLDDAIYEIHGPKMDALHPGIEQALDSIRERIKAMLPPE